MRAERQTDTQARDYNTLHPSMGRSNDILSTTALSGALVADDVDYSYIKHCIWASFSSDAF